MIDSHCHLDAPEFDGDRLAVLQRARAAGVTGLVVTKLDGSAKGGVVFALGREFKLPIRYIGVGERLDDLRTFDPVEFVDALLPRRDQAVAAEPAAAS